MSYHGGSVLSGMDVNPEYISAFKQQKQEKKERRLSGRGSSNFMDSSWVSGEVIEETTEKEDDAFDEAVHFEEDEEVMRYEHGV